MARTKAGSARKVGIYVRVSKDEDGDEESTARQEEDCRHLCSDRGWPVADVYRDVDLSAFDRKVRRPEYERLQADLRSGRIDTVVVWKLDRLVRRTRAVSEFLDLLDETNGDLASVNDPHLDTTAAGRFLLQIMASVAELESENTAMRVRRAKRAEAEAGQPHRGGSTPYGWQADKRTLDPHQAGILREVTTRLLDDGESLSAIARDLQERGERTNRGQFLRVGNLRNMLLSPRLAGYRQHVSGPRASRSANGTADTRLYEGDWEPVLDRETWRRLAARFGREIIEAEDGPRLAIIGTGRKRAAAKEYLLTGYVWCGRPGCGERMRVMSGQRRRDGTPELARYVCATCQGVSVYVDVADEVVTKEVLDVLFGRRMLGEDEPEVNAADLEAQVERTRSRMADLTRSFYVDEALTEDEFRAARDPLAERLATLEGRLVQAQELRSSVPHGEVREDFSEWWAAAPLGDRRRVLSGALDRVTVLPMTREFTLPFRPGGEADDGRPPLTGVPKALWRKVSAARVQVTLREDLDVPTPGTTSAPD